MDMLETFLNFEKKNNLLETSIEGVYFWHIIRFELFNEIQFVKGNAERVPPVQISKISALKKSILLIKSGVKNNPFILNNEKDILLLNHPRRVLDDFGFYKCLYTDTIRESITIKGFSHITFEEPYNKTHYTPVEDDCLKYTDYIRFIDKAVRIFYKKKLNKKDSELIVKTFVDLSKALDIDLSLEKWLEKVNSLIRSYKIRYLLYKWILRKVNPKVIIESVSYIHDRFVINQVAKEKNIPVIELQHGTMGKYHVAYNFAQKTSIKTFPDYIFTFGDYWKNTTRFPIKESNIISVGWPFYENKLNLHEGEKENKKKTILFISQSTVGKDLSRFAVDIDKKLDIKEYEIIYKLHPAEYDIWKKEYPWLLNSKIKVIDNSNHDMHYFFNQVDAQIGVYSTAIFEGLGYGLETYIVKLYGYKNMESLYNEGHVKLVESVNEIIKSLRTDGQKEKLFNTNYFWEQNSIENVLNEITRIMEISVIHK